MIATLITGAIAGWLGGTIYRGSGLGLLGNIIVDKHTYIFSNPSKIVHHPEARTNSIPIRIDMRCYNNIFCRQKHIAGFF